MTRDELIEELTKRATACGEIRTRHDESGAIERLRGKAAAYAHAAELAEQLDSLPAMTWQDEPSGEGWYWVCGERIESAWVVDNMHGGWTCVFGPYSGLLNGRRVCPIPTPPPLPKRGES